MAGVFFGAVTIGGALIGLSTGIATVGTAFDSLRDTVSTQSVALDSAVSTLSAQSSTLSGIGDIVVSIGDTIESAKASIRLPAAGGLDAQIAAILQAQTGLTASLSNPAAYVAGLIAGATQAVTNITAAVPTVQITGQLTAAGLLLVSLQAQVSVIDAALASLDAPAAAVRAQGEAIVSASAAIDATLLAIQSIIGALNAAVAATDVALAQLATIQASLSTGGAYAFLYTGPLSGLGAGFDAIIPSAGISGATQVMAPLIFVLQGDGPAVAAVSATYRVS